jgi:molecular chaperone DnaK
MAEHGDKIDEAGKTAIETAIAELKTAREGTDPEAIREKTNTLSQASMKLGEAMYAAQQGQGGAAEDQPADDGVVDAEFEEVSDSDDKKSA